MKPGFALTLSDDGIRLLHRTKRGWMLVGDADLEDATVEDTLRFLRKTATALAPEGVTTKLVLPNSQILYTEVEAPGPDEALRRAQIEAALAERTPYPIADLAYDWSGTGDTVKVAVVTRLTLTEADGFAEEHRFNPVCFVSIPERDTFDGEPFFGLTSRATDHLPSGATMERDARPVRVVGLVDVIDTPASDQNRLHTAPEGAGSDDAGFEDAGFEDAGFKDAGPQSANGQSANDQSAAPDLTVGANDIGDTTDARTGAVLDADTTEGASPVIDPLDEPATPVSDAGQVPARDDAVPDAVVDVDPVTAASVPLDVLAVEAAATLNPGAAEGPETGHGPVAGSALRNDEPAAQVEPPLIADSESAVDGDPADILPEEAVPADADSGTETAAADAPDDVPEAPFAVVDPDEPLAGDPATEPTRGTETPAAPGGGFTSRRKHPFGARPEDAMMSGLRHTAPRIGGITSPVGVTAPMVSDTNDAPEALPDALPGAALGDALRKRAGKKTAVSRSTGLRAEPVASRGAPAAPLPQPPLRRPVKTAVQESEELTIFGARRSQVGGKPRYLGPVLIGGLIALIGLVGLWSSLSGSDTTQSEPQPATLEQSSLQPGTDPVRADAEPATEPQPDPAAASEPASDPALADAALDPAPTVPPGAATVAAPVEPAASTAGPIAGNPGTGPTDPVAPGADNATSVDGAPETAAPAPATGPAAGGGGAPVPAGTYAAQSQPDTTAAESITADSTPAIPDATDLPAGQALLHDAPLSPQPLPLPYGALVKYGPDGLIIPSKEGVQTPTGITLFLGKPPVAPKVRPAKVVEAAAVAATPVVTAPATAALPAAAPEPFADPKLRGKRPAARPATLPTASPGTPQDQGAVTPELAPLKPVDPRHAAQKPMVRPASVLARAAAAAPAVEVAAAQPTPEAAPAPVAGGTRLAVVQSRRPAERPSDVSKAVESALAAAVAEPEPAPEPVPVVQVTPEPAPAPAVPQVNADTAVAEASAVEIDEPEPVAAAPGIPTRASVAKQATYANAIDLGKINLIGIMGSSADRRALIRTSNGRYVRVKVGDRFDGGRVASIGNGQLTYVKGGRTIVLKMLTAG